MKFHQLLLFLAATVGGTSAAHLRGLADTAAPVEDSSDASSNDGPSFKFDMSPSGPRINHTFPGAGQAYFLDPSKVRNATMGLAFLELLPGSVRELHWHPEAAEWGFITQGQCRITLMNNDGQYDNLVASVGDIWYFPKSWGHAIQSVDPDVPCNMVLFFNAPQVPTVNDIGLSEIVNSLPVDVVSENLNVDPSVVKTFYQGHQDNPYYSGATILINKGTLPAPAFPQSTNPLPQTPIINILKGSCKSWGTGGNIYEIRNDIFPASTDMSGGLIHLSPGTLRDIHWHPDADEMHYILKGSVSVTVYSIGPYMETFTLQTGDVGFVPKGMAHYFEALYEEEAEILLAFNSPSWKTQELSTWLGLTPSYLIAASLNTTTDAVKDFPKAEEWFIGNTFNGCPGAPSLPDCYGCDLVDVYKG